MVCKILTMQLIQENNVNVTKTKNPGQYDFLKIFEHLLKILIY